MSLIFPSKNRLILEQRVYDFRVNLCSLFCDKCPSNCCCGRLHPNIGKSRYFDDLPRVGAKDLKKNYQGGLLEPPYIVQESDSYNYLVGVCPHLDAKSRCSMHANAERPQDCIKYPVYLVYPFSFAFLKPFLQVETNCYIWEEGVNCRKAYKFAYDNGIGIHFS